METNVVAAVASFHLIPQTTMYEVKRPGKCQNTSIFVIWYAKPFGNVKWLEEVTSNNWRKLYLSDIWRCLAKFGDIWQHLAMFGNVSRRLTTFGYSWQCLVTFGYVWWHLVPFGNIWWRLVTFGHIWQSLVTFGCAWHHLATFGEVWQRLATLGYVLPRRRPRHRRCLGLFDASPTSKSGSFLSES